MVHEPKDGFWEEVSEPNFLVAHLLHGAGLHIVVCFFSWSMVMVIGANLINQADGAWGCRHPTVGCEKVFFHRASTFSTFPNAFTGSTVTSTKVRR